MIEHAKGVTADFLKSNRFQITVNDRMVGASLSVASFYDPKSEHVRR